MSEDKKPATMEMEATPEMIAAGAIALREEAGDECPTFGLEEIVNAVYRAMMLASGRINARIR